MPHSMTKRTPAFKKGWASRLFSTFGMSGAPVPKRETVRPEQEDTSRGDVGGMARKLVADDRYCFVLLQESEEDVDEANAEKAWKVLEAGMALVPTGVIPVVPTSGPRVPVEISAFYLDRCSVTNKQFQRFVVDGGYENLEIWPQSVWPSLMNFTDRTRRPGPRDWAGGVFPSGKGEHPVTGICWFEAAAYAVWVGKRLPTAAEWQKAGGWPQQLNGSTSNRFPWGPIYEPERANLWASKVGQTVPVQDFPQGSTPNGIHQMTGNVWEWLADLLDAIPSQPGLRFDNRKPIRRIVGGAFDTFLPAEAACHFITGQGELDRRENIGFRCAISTNRLRRPTS